MGKAIPFIIAAIVAVFSFISAASISGGGRDYANSSEEQQQQYLENVAKGFKTGFLIGAGRTAEITQTFVDAEVDLISFTVTFIDKRVENTPMGHIQKQQRLIANNACAMAEKKKLLENGVTMRIRMYRPSGASIGAVQIDEENCAEFLA